MIYLVIVFFMILGVYLVHVGSIFRHQSELPSAQFLTPLWFWLWFMCPLMPHLGLLYVIFCQLHVSFLFCNNSLPNRLSHMRYVRRSLSFIIIYQCLQHVASVACYIPSYYIIYNLISVVGVFFCLGSSYMAGVSSSAFF